MTEVCGVPLKTMVQDFSLEVVFAASDFDRIQLTVEDISRPGLQIAGYMDHFEPMRLQIIGNVESSYLDKLTSAERYIVYDRLFAYKFPAILAAAEDAGAQWLVVEQDAPSMGRTPLQCAELSIRYLRSFL